ncbi:MAG TPA: hypothetical protein VFB36_17155 [Nevskiaceae bacterium]|nr:hypothetical protein [Nevskiaceae bacterium]
MSKLAIRASLVAALLVVACGGGSGDGHVDEPGPPPPTGGGDPDFNSQSNEFCHTIPSRGFTSVGVTTGNETAAFDDDFGTGANIQPGGELTIRGTTDKQAGGSVAGVYLGSPADGMTVILTTFLNGRPQQVNPIPVTRLGPADNCSGFAICDWTDHGTFIGIPTTADYDAIGVVISNSSTSDLYVNELCVK